MSSAEDTRIHDVTTTLRSELAALQYKRDRLLSEVTVPQITYSADVFALVKIF